ncbi:sugar ABC transporter ATP-binding protein [Mesorhizobium comanense]|uniref:sugar ABC transporter ATP-binding protein n=1 Tax=Mesorhizobium comanense TaxID=2502215 RepID=UPI001485682B|nr:sugar ABC transporter ATP-binding protein [Mesorhizobium comanense]
MTLTATDLTKSYGENQVLKGVTIFVEPGRVRGLLGENGAGKSTLIRILAGITRADHGEVTVNGERMRSNRPQLFLAAGVSVAHQELSLCPNLTVAENIVVAAGQYLGFIAYRQVAENFERLRRELELPFSGSSVVGNLPLGSRQLLEIAKALASDPRYLILDEPTSSLSSAEFQTICRAVERRTGQGMGTLFISHRMEEVRRICRPLTVLRDGKVSADIDNAETVSDMDLVERMTGREAGTKFPPYHNATTNRVALQVAGLGAPSSVPITDVTFDLRAGEILGIGGLAGHGQETVLRAIFGADRSTGTLTVDGSAFARGSVGAAMRAGIAYVPADRRQESLLLQMPVSTNAVLPSLGRLARHGWRRFDDEHRHVHRMLSRFSVKGRASDAIATLSGGNQQKIALGKWLDRQPKVLLLNDPTRGVDIPTKLLIYRELQAEAERGTAIILSSSDTLELQEFADRVLIMRNGRIATELDHAQASEQAIVAASLGVANASKGTI